MRIALVMSDQNYGGMQQAFLNYSIELLKLGIPILCVIRNESVVENKLREAGISSIAVINDRFGFHDPFAIRQIGEALDEFFHCPPLHIVQSFGSRATLFANRLKSQVRRWQFPRSDCEDKLTEMDLKISDVTLGNSTTKQLTENSLESILNESNTYQKKDYESSKLGR